MKLLSEPTLGVLTSADVEKSSQNPQGRQTVPYFFIPEDNAVCIVTYGSTGNSKVIVVRHWALVTRMLAKGGALGFQGGRCLQFATSTWDVFITDIFCICILSEEDRLFNQPQRNSRNPHANICTSAHSRLVSHAENSRFLRRSPLCRCCALILAERHFALSRLWACRDRGLHHRFHCPTSRNHWISV